VASTVALCGLTLLGSACGDDSPTTSSADPPRPPDATTAASGTAGPAAAPTERSGPAAAPSAAPDEQATLTLQVSNQSFDDDPVGITVDLDGDVIVDDEFSVGAQHNWVTFEIPVAPGDHELTMRSSTGAEAREALSMPAAGHLWAVVGYWYSPQTPRSFSIIVDDEPIGTA